MNPDTPRLRLSVLGIIVVSLFAALFARLWYLQVMSGSQYQVAADNNRIRIVAEEAPRGRILDTLGRVIVDNRISVQVTVDRSVLGKLPTAQQTDVLTKVAGALAGAGIPMTVDKLETRIKDQRFSPYVPVPIASDVPEDLKIWIDEHQAELPSVEANRVAVRRYPYGQLAAHVVGYTGKVTKEELDSHDASKAVTKTKPYTLNDEIGKYGIEKTYEADLRGTPGVRRIEVDSKGNPVRTLERDAADPRRRHRPQPQHRRAGRGRAGAAERPRPRRPHPHRRQRHRRTRDRSARAWSIDPRNGGVLAMASYPTFNPADFVDGISETRVGVPPGAREPLPAEQLGAPGPVRARAPRSSRSPRRPVWPPA